MGVNPNLDPAPAAPAQAPELFISAIVVRQGSLFDVRAGHDPYFLHELLWTGFPTPEEAIEARILYRYDREGGLGFVYVQTRARPDWSRLPEALKDNVVQPRPLTIPEGPRLRFRLLAKPSFRVANRESEVRGKRRTLFREAHCLRWLMRKGREGGFAVEDCALTELVWHDSKTPQKDPNGAEKRLRGTLFEGVLIVTDRARLLETVANGVGPNKAFGFGLLSLAPAE
jgi:CRISPR system Cascade subunit CasE